MKDPKTLQDAVQYFTDYENCKAFMVALRWPDGKVLCPQCDSDHVVYLEKARVWKCYGKHKKAKFSLKTGTIFEDSPLGLDKWLPCVWMLVNCKNGVSSYEIMRGLGVTQKTAWFMLQRIRLAMQEKSAAKFSGEVEVDETYIGGKARNMHQDRKLRMLGGAGGSATGKVGVQGILQRGGKIRTHVLRRPQHGWTMVGNITDAVEPGSHIYTDEAQSYFGIPREYQHEFINHAETYVQGRVHTNGLENFWSLFKRGLHGTYVSVEPFHLFRYADEQAFRYNNRATKKNPITDSDRFQLALSQIVGKRLTFAEVTGKVGETSKN